MSVCLSVLAQTHVYVINGQRIDRFDGSQLTGKTITSYQLRSVPDSQLTYHQIQTADDWVRIDSNGHHNRIVYRNDSDSSMMTVVYGSTRVVNAPVSDAPLVFFDGKELMGDFEDISSEDVNNIEFFGPGSSVALSYGEKGRNGVVMVTSKHIEKETDKRAVVYFIDGKRVSEKEVNRLSSDAIKEVQVFKRGSKAAVKECTEGKTHDIILIKTKKTLSFDKGQLPDTRWRCPLISICETTVICHVSPQFVNPQQLEYIPLPSLS